MDFSYMSYTELQHMQTVLADAMAQRRNRERELLMEEFVALARARGFALEDLFPSAQVPLPEEVSKPPHRRQPVPVKYRHPENPELTWTGRGKTPKWITTWLEEGKEMTALVV
jgi:DNA-binding protein H-NS